eukprot:5552598-Pleurochrysis_carterae.AAC.1
MVKPSPKTPFLAESGGWPTERRALFTPPFQLGTELRGAFLKTPRACRCTLAERRPTACAISKRVP